MLALVLGDSCVARVRFFQAEDGIRDGTVTGVQTCALPIFPRALSCPCSPEPLKVRLGMILSVGVVLLGNPRRPSSAPREGNGLLSQEASYLTVHLLLYYEIYILSRMKWEMGSVPIISKGRKLEMVQSMEKGIRYRKRPKTPFQMANRNS